MNTIIIININIFIIILFIIINIINFNLLNINYFNNIYINNYTPKCACINTSISIITSINIGICCKDSTICSTFASDLINFKIN